MPILKQRKKRARITLKVKQKPKRASFYRYTPRKSISNESGTKSFENFKSKTQKNKHNENNTQNLSKTDHFYQKGDTGQEISNLQKNNNYNLDKFMSGSPSLVDLFSKPSDDIQEKSQIQNLNRAVLDNLFSKDSTHLFLSQKENVKSDESSNNESETITDIHSFPETSSLLKKSQLTQNVIPEQKRDLTQNEPLNPVENPSVSPETIYQKHKAYFRKSIKPFSGQSLLQADLYLLYDVIIKKLSRRHNSFSIASRIFFKLWKELIEDEFEKKKIFLPQNCDTKMTLSNIFKNIQKIRDPGLYSTLLPISTLTSIIVISLKLADEIAYLDTISNAIIDFFQEQDFLRKLFDSNEKNFLQIFYIENDYLYVLRENVVKNKLTEFLEPFTVTNEEVSILNRLNFKINFIDLYRHVGLRLSSMTVSKTIFTYAVTVLTDMHFTDILEVNFSEDDVFAAVCYFAFEIYKNKHKKASQTDEVAERHIQTDEKTKTTVQKSDKSSNDTLKIKNTTNSSHGMGNFDKNSSLRGNFSILSEISQPQDRNGILQLLFDLNIIDTSNFLTFIETRNKSMIRMPDSQFTEDLANLLIGFDYNQEKVQKILIKMLNFYDKLK